MERLKAKDRVPKGPLNVVKANTLHRLEEESWGKERSLRAQKGYRAWSKNTDRR